MKSTIQRIIITRIKNLVDVEIELDERKRLTAIMGPNGHGKSTILHVLAACFKAVSIKRGGQTLEIGESRKFVDFFPTTPHNNWAGTSLRVVTKETKDNDVSEIKPIDISKGESGAWIPKHESKPQRETYYIGASTASPEIELRREAEDVHFVSSSQKDHLSAALKKRLSDIFNRNYTAILDNEVSKEKRLIGLGYGGISYSSLAMGAGEQRAFLILKTALSCQNNALLLIDEIDLLLHTEALDGLISALLAIARKKNLQIFFTTHRESILEHADKVAIRHIYNQSRVSPKTYCFNESKPGAIQRLTGKLPQSLSICCEDEVAAAIVRRISQEVGISAHVKIQHYGSWSNCFTLTAALTLIEEGLPNTLLLLDGDVAECKTIEQKKDILNHTITGSSPPAIRRRADSLKSIVEFSPAIEGTGPEKALYDMVSTLDPTSPFADTELIRAFLNVEGVADTHDYVSKPIKYLCETKEAGLSRIISSACRSAAWQGYTAPIRNWLLERKPNLQEAPELNA